MDLVKGLCVLFLSLVIISCSNGDSELNVRPGDKGEEGTLGKPLPSECLPDTKAFLSWNADTKALAYVIEVGTEPEKYHQVHSIHGYKKFLPIKLERGATYYIKANKYFNNSAAPQFETMKIAAPACDERTAYKKDHPDYVEPFEKFITWKNK